MSNETDGAKIIPFEPVTITAPEEVHPTVSLVDALNALTVTSEAELENAGALLKDCKALVKQIKDDFEPSVKAAKAAYDAIREQRNQHLKPLEQADHDLRNRMQVYMSAEDRRREEEARQEQERLRKAQEESAMQHAEDLSAQGKDDAAQRLVDSVANAPQPEVAKPAAPVSRSNVGGVKKWKAKVVDEDALYKALAEHVFLRDCAPISDKVLNQKARNKKGPSDIPGVEFFQEQGMRLK